MWKLCVLLVSAPSISHLLFADNLMVFCKANISQKNCLLDVFNKFHEVSGQCVNFSKSAALLSPCLHPKFRRLLIWRIKMKYLVSGALHYGLAGKRMLIFIICLIMWGLKFKGGNPIFLSGSGKPCLIKSMRNVMANFAMSCFKIPQSILKKKLILPNVIFCGGISKRILEDYVWRNGKIYVLLYNVVVWYKKDKVLSDHSLTNLDWPLHLYLLVF